MPGIDLLVGEGALRVPVVQVKGQAAFSGRYRRSGINIKELRLDEPGPAAGVDFLPSPGPREWPRTASLPGPGTRRDTWEAA